MLRRVSCLLVLFLVSSIVNAQSTRENVFSTIEQIQREFDVVPCRKEERLPAVRALFEKMGAKSEDITTQKTGNVENVVVRRASVPPVPDTIIIGAHYDFAGRGCGVVDNWTGVVTMAHLYRTIANFVPRKNTLFVAFDREEQGLMGSRAMVKAIKKEDVPHYCAMINLDSFGLGGPFAMGDISSPSLIRLSEDVADELKLPFVGFEIRRVDSDSSSFIKKNIPALTLSGLSRDWKSILHTKNDQAGKVQPSDVHVGYRVALSVWQRIEESPCNAFADARK